jgi:2-dehydropantoate 2-reductase
VGAGSIVVVGAGGVGGYFGAKLVRAGQAVTFLGRGAHLDAMRRAGLRVRSAIEGEWTVRVDAVDTLRGRPPADVAILAVKSFDTEAALAALEPVVGPSTAVLTLQNGIDNVDKIDGALGPGHALGGAAYVFAGIDAPGVIVHRALGRVALGELDGQVSARARAVHAALTGAQIPAELSTDIRRVMWEKYIYICAQAGTTAVTRASIGVIRQTPETWRLFRTILEELTALATAAGIAVGADVVERALITASQLAPEATSSLANDLAQGRRLELEALHGHAVTLADKLGVPTPALGAVYAALKPHVGGRRT